MYSSVPKDDTVQNLKNSAQTVKNEARETAGEVKDDLRGAANKAGRKVRSFFDTASGEWTHATDAVTTHIHEKPMQSTLIALGLGFVAGMLFRR